MSETKGYWRGKPLEDYTKDELIEIILSQGRQRVEQVEQHHKDLEALAPRKKL